MGQGTGGGRDGKIMSNTGFKFAAAQMFGLQDDTSNPPQNLAIQALQLAFLLMWVSGFLNTMNVSCSTSPDLQVTIARVQHF